MNSTFDQSTSFKFFIFNLFENREHPEKFPVSLREPSKIIMSCQSNLKSSQSCCFPICKPQCIKHTASCSCTCRIIPKKIITHQVCGPDVPYCGPALCTPAQYLYWSNRPIITYTSTDEVKYSWNLKRRTANIPDIMFEEMYDKNGCRYF
ncbi:unnamed protein product [Chironomus riparius]|uniref:Uncharacterized protein n=1 Tax=Chironomus riparius TaxID=315576 RepID=A0A9N9S1V1_9DIPT|nr:unnamed protein product [Chironomus riparius]